MMIVDESFGTISKNLETKIRELESQGNPVFPDHNTNEIS